MHRRPRLTLQRPEGQARGPAPLSAPATLPCASPWFGSGTRLSLGSAAALGYCAASVHFRPLASAGYVDSE